MIPQRCISASGGTLRSATTTPTYILPTSGFRLDPLLLYYFQTLFTYGEAVGYRLDIFVFFFFFLLLCHFTF